MADLIDRAALLAAGNVRKMKDALEDWDALDNKTKIIVLRYAKAHKKLVETAPAVDAVEVVRCGNCRYFFVDEDYAKHGLCRAYPLGIAKLPMDYCSLGERRTDATD